MQFFTILEKIREIFNFKDLKNLFILVFGAGGNRAIFSLTTLLLTRIYSPKDFGEFTFYLFFFSTGACFVTLQIEKLAIFCKYKKEGLQIIFFSIFLCFLICSSLKIIFEFLHYFSTSHLVLNLFDILPYHLFFQGLMEIILSFMVRQKKFITISLCYLINGFFTCVTQFIFGFFFFPQAKFLIYGSFIGNLIASCFLIIFFSGKKIRYYFRLFSFEKTIAILSSHKGYIGYTFIASVTDQLRIGLPIFLLSHFFSAELLGFYFLASKILSIPSSVIGIALRKFSLQKIAQALHRKKNILSIFFIFSIITFIFSIFVFISLNIFCLYILPIFLTEKWQEALGILPVLSLSAAVEFTIIPFLSIFGLIKQQHILTIYKVAFLIINTIILSIIAFLGKISLFWVMLGVLNSLLYGFFLFILVKQLKKMNLSE